MSLLKHLTFLFARLLEIYQTQACAAKHNFEKMAKMTVSKLYVLNLNQICVT